MILCSHSGRRTTRQLTTLPLIAFRDEGYRRTVASWNAHNERPLEASPLTIPGYPNSLCWESGKWIYPGPLTIPWNFYNRRRHATIADRRSVGTQSNQPSTKGELDTVQSNLNSPRHRFCGHKARDSITAEEISPWRCWSTCSISIPDPTLLHSPSVLQRNTASASARSD